MSEPKYTMTMDLNILNHLGLNLYSNVAAVLSEAVANAWDADSEVVEINLLSDKIEIIDNGHGMTEEDINNKYLRVGRKKRDNGETITPIHHRPVMGRKGIGKLSLFSIAKEIQVESVKDGQKSALLMRTDDIEAQVRLTGKTYHPTDLGSNAVSIEKGTKITLTSLKKNIDNSDSYLRKRLARRFSVIGPKKNFIVNVDGNPITVSDRDFYKKLEFAWLINVPVDDFNDKICPNLKHIHSFNNDVDDRPDWSISGWIGSVESTNQLSDDKSSGQTDNKIVLLSRGKLVQENILDVFNIGSIYSKYLIGEINADFLDTDAENDISTSNRQSLIEDDPRYIRLIGHIYKLLQKVQKDWEKGRSSLATTKAINEFPVLANWYSDLTPNLKPSAEKLFSTIQNLHFDKLSDDNLKKKELYKQGILAFERFQLQKNLEAINYLSEATEIRFDGIFADVNDIEALLYYDIASQRVAVIRELSGILDENKKERIIQKHLFDNLWLLNPSWERATRGSERMEERVYKEFDAVTAKLSEEEKRGRIDIKYRTSAGKHIIIELKRYKPNYAITGAMLAEQVDKYREGLKKCLKTIDREHEPIESIVILGTPLAQDKALVASFLNVVNARLKYYDELIEEALDSYQDFLDKSAQASKLKHVIDNL